MSNKPLLSPEEPTLTTFALAPQRNDSSRLVEKTVNVLRQQIVDGQYGAEGELPPQGELSRSLNVSRSVIREAMRELQSMRLISVSQGRKSRVVPAGADAVADSLQLLMQRTNISLLELADVRQVIEVEIVGRSAQRLTEETLLALRIAIHELQKAKTVERQIQADVDFHHVLAQASGNQIFVFLLDALAALLRESRRRTIGRGGVEPALRGHRAIFAAVERGDPCAARQAMFDHLQESTGDLKASEEEMRGKI